MREYMCDWSENARVVTGNLQRPPGEFDARAPVRLSVLAPTPHIDLLVVPCGQGQRGRELRIEVYRPPKQIERLSDLVPVERQVIWQCSQVEIVGREIFSRALARTTKLGALQSRLDNGGYARSDLVLKIEHVF
jgi:hypothetical protein